MLQFSNLAIRRGTRVLFSGASFTIPAQRKVGVVGANGCGKSSLFELILHKIESDEGSLQLAGTPVIAHVAQHSASDERDALEHVLDGDRELRELQRALHDNPEDAALQARMEDIGGYAAQARAARLLDGLGFDSGRMQVATSTLSGGWRMRINLAQALMCRSDLLLLDEPTNHLDLDAVIWLEQWLRGYPGTLLLISHDREFLDRSVDHILAYENPELVLSTGNYSDYERRRAERLGQQQAAYARQQREIDHMENFVRRFRAKATKAKQAQSRLKALERMARIAPAHVDMPFDFAFREPQNLPDPLLKLEHACAGYADTNILADITLALSPGDRIGLLGLNGAGKSTLSRVLAGRRCPALTGWSPAKHLAVGYFAQHQLDLLHPEATPAEHFVQQFALHDEQMLRDFLGGFGFSGDRVFEPVAPFSGGEKARLVLAMLVYRQPNLLILDEPTNHLDLDMRHALTVALQDYPGAVVLVSHDRHLLQTSTSDLLLVDRGKVEPFNDSLDEYPRWLAGRRSGSTPQDTTAPRSNRRQDRQQAAQLRRQLKPLSDQVRRLEKTINALQDQCRSLDEQLSDPDIYSSGDNLRLVDLNRRRAELGREVEQAEAEWMEALEVLENAEIEARA